MNTSTATNPLSMAFVAVSQAEAVLRDAVRLDLSRADGPLWMSRIPEEYRDKWQQRQQSNESKGWSRGQELIEYAEIAENISLINKYWDVFEPRFGDLKAAQKELDEFRVLRNAIMHNGARLSANDCRHAIEVANNILALCTAEIQPKSRPASSVPPGPKPDKRPSDEHQAGLHRAIVQAMSKMSGLLTGERDAVLAYLRENLRRCSPETVAAVYKKFTSLPGTQMLIESLHRDLPPTRPSRPLNSRKPSDWLKWADLQYIPYRRWLIQTGEYDEEVEQMATDYEDWLSHNYSDLLLRFQDNLVVSAYKVAKEQLGDRYRVLWLVVDNLCGLWRPEFLSELAKVGVHVQVTRRMLAMLPSITYISRRAMLAGRLPSEAIRFADDESAFRQLWRDLGIPNVSYCTSFKQLDAAIGQNTPLILLMYNWLDTLAHMSAQPGFERQDQMTLAMSDLALKVAVAMRTMRQVGPVRLIVSTDHGSTLFGSHSQQVALPPSAIANNEPENHSRYAIVGNTAGLNATDWHILDAAACDLPYTVAVTRGQRYINSRPRAFVHGGLTPEETVVSLIVADIGEREPLQLVLSQATPSLRLGRPGSLAILVRNPFDMPIENLVLSLPEYDLKFAPLDVPARSEIPTDECQISLNPDLEIHNGTISIACAGQFHIAGQVALLSEQLRVNVHLLYQPAPDDFGDMFDV
jgi:hypothetical protein